MEQHGPSWRKHPVHARGISYARKGCELHLKILHFARQHPPSLAAWHFLVCGRIHRFERYLSVPCGMHLSEQNVSDVCITSKPLKPPQEPNFWKPWSHGKSTPIVLTWTCECTTCSSMRSMSMVGQQKWRESMCFTWVDLYTAWGCTGGTMKTQARGKLCTGPW